jgi:crossover junction endodeoxyribonuclease RuvC
MRVIGIDPGTNIVGFAITEGTQNNPKILNFGVLHTKPSVSSNMPNRLVEIAEDLESLVKKYKPQKAVVEDIFFFKNQKTIISVAQSRGVILYILAKYKIVITSLTPLQIKQNVCGYGRASKKQVQEMVKQIYKLEKVPKPDDASDSLAMAWLGLQN